MIEPYFLTIYVYIWHEGGKKVYFTRLFLFILNEVEKVVYHVEYEATKKNVTNKGKPKNAHRGKTKNQSGIRVYSGFVLARSKQDTKL